MAGSAWCERPPIACYALLSVLPVLILSVIVLSHVVDQAELFNTLGRNGRSAGLSLLGAQVISEYGQLDQE